MSVFVDALDLEGAQTYLDLRPGYPRDVVAAIHGALGPSSVTPTGVDIGAGSGQMTRLLVESGFQTTAVEPSSSMRNVLLRQPWVREAPVAVTDTSAEDTGLPAGSFDVVTWAQCFHWLDPVAASAEAARILRPGGVGAVVYNQLDVRRPWVHRLSRVMRSGDVLERQGSPDLGPQFTSLGRTEFEWVQVLSPEQIMGLGQTRSSYLRASEAGRAKMQDNLRWYLFDHLGFYPGEAIELPYRTFLWLGRVRA